MYKLIFILGGFNMTLRKFGDRICIPQKMCKELNFSECEEVEITIEYGYLCVKKFDAQEISKKPYIGIVRKLDLQHCLRIPTEYLKTLHILPNRYVQFELDKAEQKIKISSL